MPLSRIKPSKLNWSAMLMASACVLVDRSAWLADGLAQISVSSSAMLNLPSATFALRRHLAASRPIMPELAGRFTLSELAALRIVADELTLTRHGHCDLSIDRIAELSGVSRTSVKSMLLKGEYLRLVTVRGSRRINIVELRSAAWRTWLSDPENGCRNFLLSTR
jgi:hypothetical protein